MKKNKKGSLFYETPYTQYTRKT